MKRPMFLIGFVYLFALAIFQSIPEKNLIFTPIISALMCLVLIVFSSLRKNKTIIFSALTITFAAILSFVNFKINIEPIQKYDKQEKIISGIIEDLPYEKNGSLYYKMKIDYIENESVKPFSVMISSGMPLECDFGDRFYCTAHFYVPQSSYFFDSKQYYRSRGIYINAYIKIQDDTHTQKDAENGLNYKILKLRSKMLEASKNFLAEEIANVQNGIFLGERNGISNSQRIVFLKNGIFHLICTSGIHISIIMTGFLWLFKKLKFGQKLSYLISIIPVLIFIPLTGFSLSAIRAGIVCVIFLLGMALSKKSDALNSLGLSVFLICIINQNSALSLGLWLSALSVLGIIIFNQKIFLFLKSKLNKKTSNHPIIKFILSVVSISLSASVFTAPLTIFYSKIFSFAQVLTNIIFIPLTTIILISALTLSILWVLGAPNLTMYPFAFLSGMSVKIFIKLSEFFSKIPLCYISLDYPFIKFWIGIVILTIAVCLTIFKPAKALIFSVIISLGSLICGIFSYQIIEFNNTHIAFINGGESVLCAVQKNGHTACISCFGEKNYTKNFENFLECRNITDIDYFAVINAENLPDKFIENTIINHRINCLILPSKNVEHISLGGISDTHTVYFDSKLHSNIWGGELTIDCAGDDNCTYAKITIDKTSILIIPNSGNTTNIPDSMKNCNIVLSYGMPKNFGEVNSEAVIAYGPQHVISNDMQKFGGNVKIYNLSYYGKLNMRGKNNNYKIGV